MKTLNEEVLVVGDIILTTTNKVDSKAIRKFTKSDISHAMVYVDPCSVMDATGEGVHARNTQRMFFPEDCAIHVLRPKSPLSKRESDIICNFVRSHVGTEYSKREAAATLVTGLRNWSAKQFCSRLVAQAYATAGRYLVPDPNYCSPADIKNSPHLEGVDHATRYAPDDEVERWRRDLDMTQITRDATNTLLDAIRKKSKAIQNLNDADAHLVEHPEDDAHFCGALKTSGYLTLWELEMDKNSWQYDVTLLDATGWPQEQIESYCLMVRETAKNGGTRYHLNKAGYLRLSTEHGLEYFAILSSLYETLADLDMQRFQVATQWLNARDASATVPDPYSEPHTPEWFSALEKWNSYQADMARIVTEREGRLDICSICGDDPAPVYRTESDPPPGSVATLRLCSDCLEIRSHKGEKFILLVAK